MIKRTIEKKCLTLFKQYPVLTIMGPRQSGKTTLAKELFKKLPYVNFEEPDVRLMAINDPRGFLEKYKQGAIFDEIQRVPEIPSYLQAIVDATGKNGQFVLTGSQQFSVSNKITQSLAGRTAIVKLLPLSLEEILSLPSAKAPKTVEQLMFMGGYPKLYKEKVAPLNYYMNYFETYVQRDIRQLSQIDDLHIFEKFVMTLAARVGQLLNFNSIANDLGVSQPIIKKWFSLLEASFIAYPLKPFHSNIGKRLIKTPKIYFYDTGLLCSLLGITKESDLRMHALRGNIFENFVVNEFVKARLNNALALNLFFYRDKSGNEVDIVIENALSLDLFEIKSSATINNDFLKSINIVAQIQKLNIKTKAVIYAGEQSGKINGANIVPWKDLKSFF